MSVELSDRFLAIIQIVPLSSDELLIAKDFAEHAKRTEIERNALKGALEAADQLANEIETKFWDLNDDRIRLRWAQYTQARSAVKKPTG